MQLIKLAAVENVEKSRAKERLLAVYLHRGFTFVRGQKQTKCFH